MLIFIRVGALLLLFYKKVDQLIKEVCHALNGAVLH